MTAADLVPPAAATIRDFVNSYEPQIDREALTDVSTTTVWLVEHRLAVTPSEITATEVERLITIREGLRTVLLVNAGHDADDPAALGRLGDALAAHPLRVDFPEGALRFVSVGSDPVGTAVAILVDAIRQADHDHSWDRLKVCARDTCRWAYYDTSRNKVRRWCSMAGCGNYVKMRRAASRRTAARREPDPDPT